MCPSSRQRVRDRWLERSLQKYNVAMAMAVGNSQTSWRNHASPWCGSQLDRKRVYVVVVLVVLVVGTNPTTLQRDARELSPDLAHRPPLVSGQPERTQCPPSFFRDSHALSTRDTTCDVLPVIPDLCRARALRRRRHVPGLLENVSLTLLLCKISTGVRGTCRGVFVASHSKLCQMPPVVREALWYYPTHHW